MTEMPRFQSQPVRVTLFEDRAEVDRRVVVEVAVGASWISIDGVGPFVDDRSLVVGVSGEGGRVLSSRVRRELRQIPVMGAEAIAAVEEEMRLARRRLAGAERSLARAQGDELRAAGLAERWLSSVPRVPRGGEEGAGKWQGALAAVDRQLTASLDALAAARDALDLARLDAARVQARLDAARTCQPREETTIEVQIEAAAAGALTVDLTYRSPCALWRPEHIARLVEDDKGSRLVLQTFAAAWQCTGERWEDVAFRFSTARPAEAATPPLLTDDTLVMRRKSDVERRVVSVEARDQTIQAASLGRGQRAVEDMPGVEDGGEPLWFDAPSLNLPSTGQVFRRLLCEATMPCQVDVVAFPERSEAAHLRATATLAGARPLLAGPVHLVRGGEIVGRGKLSFIAVGEPFELGFGVDDGLRIRRQIEDQRETTAITGTQHLERKVKLFVGNMSGRARKLTVVERFPVSEIDEVKVQIVDDGGSRLEHRDGFARFALTLAPRATEERELIYHIEAAARVQMQL